MRLVRVVPGENMDNWDENPSPPAIPKNIAVKSKWEGEDAEEDVLDSWDQEPEEEKSENEVNPPPQTAKKNYKKIGDKFEEKKRKHEPEPPSKPLTPEEVLAEKIRAQKAQEESDRILAKEIFGSTGLETKEDYDRFRTDIINVISDSTKNTNYVAFAEQLIQSLCVHLSSVDLKKINTTISNLSIEKGKMEKGEKAKKNKGKGKAKLKLEGDNDYSEFSAYTADDFDDFI